MASLIVAADSIYLLPYMRKSFQTSMQEVFSVSFTQLGVMNAMFGILALSAYLAGGWLSDRFSARNLLAASLFATGLGGFYMATIPAYPMLLALHAFWGVTSILTFWGALIKATRLWGAPDKQGRTFGILDGGRGVAGAFALSTAAWLFSREAAVGEGLVTVIRFYGALCVAAGVSVLLFVPQDSAHGDDGSQHVALDHLRAIVSMPVVWVQALIILLAYWIYVGTFEFASYGEQVFEQGKLFGAQLGAFKEWLRPLAAVGAGLVADRIRPTRAVAIAFAICASGYGGLVLVPGQDAWLPALWIQVAAIAIAVFALRGIYFALLEESSVPIAMTGTAVGVVSTVGFLPDVFAYPLAGWFVDHYGADAGYRGYFSLLCGAALVGAALALLLARRTSRAAVRP
jgi:sugar phosphate permease